MSSVCAHPSHLRVFRSGQWARRGRQPTETTVKCNMWSCYAELRGRARMPREQATRFCYLLSKGQRLVRPADARHVACQLDGRQWRWWQYNELVRAGDEAIRIPVATTEGGGMDKMLIHICSGADVSRADQQSARRTWPTGRATSPRQHRWVLARLPRHRPRCLPEPPRHSASAVQVRHGHLVEWRMDGMMRPGRQRLVGAGRWQRVQSGLGRVRVRCVYVRVREEERWEDGRKGQVCACA